jgi:hypothetical protein
MRTALYALHYGKEYLAYSVRSIQDAVDQIVVYYTKRPSFGFAAPLPCPDTEAELFEEANRFLTKPLLWRTGTWSNEGEHRDAALEECRRLGAEQVLVVDADEVWDTRTASACLDYVRKADRAGRWTAQFRNFWRSWRYVVRDHFRPIRVVDLRHSLEVTLDLPTEVQTVPIFHFGYAQRLELMRYKWTCHGHQAELRDGWIDRFEDWKLGDVDLHPVVNDLWTEAYVVDREDREALERIMSDHPYAGWKLIK